VQARQYIDLRCVNSKTPLIESGTLGPKGHVQVILPYKTESYGSQNDPTEDVAIPHCTLKMFPEETLHCVEWSRDKFGKLFTQRPKALKKCLEEYKDGKPETIELKAWKDALWMAKKAPKTFDDCIMYARKKFEKYFVNDIKQLMHVYPLDHKTKEGNPFWSLPKRPPTCLIFENSTQVMIDFIISFACLRANIYGVKLPDDIRNTEAKKKYIEFASKTELKVWKPDEGKARELANA